MFPPRNTQKARPHTITTNKQTKMLFKALEGNIAARPQGPGPRRKGHVGMSHRPDAFPAGHCSWGKGQLIALHSLLGGADET